MEITKTQTEKTMELALKGRLDTNTAPELEAALGDLAGVDALVLDFSALEYISSAGLGYCSPRRKV